MPAKRKPTTRRRRKIVEVNEVAIRLLIAPLKEGGFLAMAAHHKRT